MKVLLIGSPRAVLGQAQVEVDAGTAREVLAELDRRAGGRIPELDRAGTPGGPYLILVNGHSVTGLRGLETELRPKDVVTVLSLTASGPESTA